MKFKYVNIHPFKYKLKYPKTSNSDTHGVTNNKLRTVTIYPHADEQQERDTLLHEALHALLHECLFFGDNDAQEEEFVLRFTPRLLAFMQDNPRIVEFLVNEEETDQNTK